VTALARLWANDQLVRRLNLPKVPNLREVGALRGRRAYSASRDYSGALVKQAQLFPLCCHATAWKASDLFRVLCNSRLVVTYPKRKVWQIGFTCATMTHT
jgi:hypothetical protein